MTVLKRSLQGLMIVAAFFGAGFLLAGIWMFIQVPGPSKIRGCMTTVLYHVDLCPGSKSYVRLKEISPSTGRNSSNLDTDPRGTKRSSCTHESSTDRELE